MPPPPFQYQDPLPLGPDETKYRLLTTQRISVGAFEGTEVIKIAPETLTRDDLNAAKNASLSEWEANGAAMLATHIEYMADIVGPDHIGIGSDFYGGPNPPGLEDASTFPHLFAELISRGWSEAAMAKLAGRNFLRVLKDVEKQAAELAKPKAKTRKAA